MLFRRKKKFIDAKSQLSFAGWLIVISVVFFGLVLVVLFLEPIASLLNPGIDQRGLMTDFFNLLAAKWPFLVLILFIMILFGNLFSHRLVGPEYRFKQVLTSLKEKDLNVFFKLRKWDYHRALESYFRDHINALKESIRTMKKNVEEAQLALDKQETSKLKESLSNLKKEIDSYKI